MDKPKKWICDCGWSGIKPVTVKTKKGYTITVIPLCPECDLKLTDKHLKFIEK